MGLLCKWWWGGDPDELDPLSGLSLRDIYIIQKSWTPIYADAGKYGIELFIRLFRADPNTKTFFKSIRDLDEEQLSKNIQFQAHVINFMSSINMAVLNLKKPDVVIAMMNKLGVTHEKRQVQKKHFQTVKQVLVEFLRDDLHFSPALMTSWGKFVTFAYRHIFEKLTEN